jgi:hypothetical protein
MADGAIVDAALDVQAACAALAIARTAELVRRLETARHVPATWQSVSHETLQPLYRLKGLLDVLLRRRLPFRAEDISGIARAFVEGDEAMWTWLQWWPMPSLIRAIEAHSTANGLSDDVRECLKRLHAIGAGRAYGAYERRMLDRIGAILGVLQPAAHDIDTADDWGRAARAALDAMDPDVRSTWLDLLAHAATLTATKPTRPWRMRAAALVEAFGRERFVQEVAAWLGLLGAPAGGGTRAGADGFAVSTAVIAERNATILKGLVWCCADCEDQVVVRALGDAAQACFKKIPEVGARSVKAGNACIAVLGGMDALEAVAQLQRLAQRVKQPSARRLIDEALSAAAARHGLGRDDLDDLAVLDFGLENGRLRRVFGGVVADMSVAGGDVTLRWMRQDGALLRSEPAVVRREFPSERAALTRLIAGLRQALPAQRARLERTLLTERRWRFGEWRARVLDHPLVSLVARRLIWSFELPSGTVAGAWLDGVIVDALDRPVAGLTDDTPVSLWHPLDAGPAQVSAWRDWLDQHRITQPFKQAYREVYVLTDAERATETYSNRFAAHILRQHQFKALCDQRGWRYSLQGGFDGHNVPTVEVPHARMRVEFWVDSLEGDNRHSAAGIALYVTTDQVRFYRDDRIGPLPLAEAPPARLFRADA